MKDNKLDLNKLLDMKMINETEYLQLSQLLGTDVEGDLQQLSTTAEQVNQINDIRNTMEAMEMDEQLSYQEVKDSLKKIKELEKQLKAEYVSLDNVPFDMLKDLGILSDDINSEQIKELKKNLTAAQKELRAQPANPQNEIKRNVPISQGIEPKNYYKNKINQTVAKLDKMRAEYYQAQNVELASLNEVSNALKEKYNLVDIKDYIVNNMKNVFKNNNIDGSNIDVERNQIRITDTLGQLEIKAVGVDYNRATGQQIITPYYDGDFYNEGDHDTIYDKYQIAEDLLNQNKGRTLEDGTSCAI